MIEKLRESVNYLAGAAPFAPEYALVLGSGLGFLGDLCGDAVAVPYSDIPHFPVSTAPGHAGKLVFGRLAGQKVAVMQGRAHYYEGHDFDMVSYGVRALRTLGAHTLIVTNASGGVREDLMPGDIMMITDHIKLAGDSPLRGPNIPELGVRFPDMSTAYTPELRKTARMAAKHSGVSLKEGVYMFFPGPQYETPAEVRAAAILGADAVGMSTVPEVIAARHAGMRILGFSLICNKGAGLQSHALSEREVLDAAEAAKPKFSKLVLRCLEMM